MHIFFRLIVVMQKEDVLLQYTVNGTIEKFAFVNALFRNEYLQLYLFITLL